MGADDLPTIWLFLPTILRIHIPTYMQDDVYNDKFGFTENDKNDENDIDWDDLLARFIQ